MFSTISGRERTKLELKKKKNYKQVLKKTLRVPSISATTAIASSGNSKFSTSLSGAQRKSLKKKSQVKQSHKSILPKRKKSRLQFYLRNKEI